MLCTHCVYLNKMNIVCVICSDSLTPSGDIFHTPCGHIFHFVCLLQWLERSKTCPQCRERTTEQKIHRIYFNFSNNDTNVEDALSLRDKLDEMNSQLLLKDKDVKRYAEQCEKLEGQNLVLRKEVDEGQSKLNRKTSSINALKEQIKYFSKQCYELEKITREVQLLREENENCKNIQTVIEASAEEVDETISGTSDLDTLTIYISVMKRELTVSLNKIMEMSTKIKSLQRELFKISAERNFLSEEYTKRQKLEKDLVVCEAEKRFLENQLREMERNRPFYLDDTDCEFGHNANCDSNNAPKEKAIENAANGTNNENDAVSNREELPSGESCAGAKQNDEEDSPYLRVKSAGVVILLNHACTQKRSRLPQSSILSKKPRIGYSKVLSGRATSNLFAYDGFRGHSKVDVSPRLSGTRVGKAEQQVLQVKSKEPATINFK